MQGGGRAEKGGDSSSTNMDNWLSSKASWCFSSSDCSQCCPGLSAITVASLHLLIVRLLLSVSSLMIPGWALHLIILMYLFFQNIKKNIMHRKLHSN